MTAPALRVGIGGWTWGDETPEGFVFALKASRVATHRRVLAEAGDSVQRFVDSGIAELGPKLGPIVWQFAPTERLDAGEYLSLARRYGVCNVFTESPDRPAMCSSFSSPGANLAHRPRR